MDILTRTITLRCTECGGLWTPKVPKVFADNARELCTRRAMPCPKDACDGELWLHEEIKEVEE